MVGHDCVPLPGSWPHPGGQGRLRPVTDHGQRNLVGRGRDADVYAEGPGLVLRRYRGEHDSAREAAMMAHVHRYGYPVPAVERAEGRDLVMEQVEGPTMLADLGRRPWRIPGHARMLADLHRRLAAVALPAGSIAGESVVHGDLHPENVLLSPTGPVVIDWSNARTGHPLDDVAITWLILVTSDIPGGGIERVVSALGRRLFVRCFLAGFDRHALSARVAAAAARRSNDPNVTSAERARIARFVRSTTPTSPPGG